jgi:hypothetical protein
VKVQLVRKSLGLFHAENLAHKEKMCVLFRSADSLRALWQQRTVVSQRAIGQKKSGNSGTQSMAADG